MSITTYGFGGSPIVTGGFGYYYSSIPVVLVPWMTATGRAYRGPVDYRLWTDPADTRPWTDPDDRVKPSFDELTSRVFIGYNLTVPSRDKLSITTRDRGEIVIRRPEIVGSRAKPTSLTTRDRNGVPKRERDDA
jgi:hypothetical protein